MATKDKNDKPAKMYETGGTWKPKRDPIPPTPSHEVEPLMTTIWEGGKRVTRPVYGK